MSLPITINLGLSVTLLLLVLTTAFPNPADGCWWREPSTFFATVLAALSAVLGWLA
ncbi:MAG: hypothetical protein ACFCBW_20975 [Candidatus Competibacterales bacterium]